MKEAKRAVNPLRSEDFPGWYQEVIKVADLAEHAPVRGCMVIKPKGYVFWENIQRVLDGLFKKRGVENAYFPLFIPLSYLEAEATHVEGFAKESAIVTHTRLEKGADGKLYPTSPLEEPLIVRPTSEMIIGNSFSNWIKSYRDLPMRVNQWCNVVRWEMRPRLFLRTSEFLWQEGHTAHSSEKEAQIEAKLMLDLYADFVETYLAIPAIRGEKSEGERFPGAENTYTFEAMMQDGKALQMGTSHYMGENFAKASNIRYLSSEGELTYAHTTSWGLSTRVIGAMIMTHGDDDGLVQPPRIAAKHITIIPSGIKEENKAEVLGFCHKLKEELSKVRYFDQSLIAFVDERDLRSGEKAWDSIKKGYPLRIEVGPRDIEKNQFPLYLRSKEAREAIFLSKEALLANITTYLEQVHEEIYQRALIHREKNTVTATSIGEIDDIFRRDLFPGKFVLAPFKGDKAVEAEIQKKYGITIRCFPHDQPPLLSSCLFTKQPGAKQAIFAKSY